MPPRPTDLGFRGTASSMEKQINQEISLRKTLDHARNKAIRQITEENRGLKVSEKQIIKLRREYSQVFKEVSQALAAGAKGAKEYGKAVEKDTQIVIDFARRHKVSMEEATEMYKKTKEKQQEFWDSYKTKVKDAVVGMLSLYGAGKLFQRRIEEINGGQRLFAATVPLTAEGFKKTGQYVDQYRDVMRSAIPVAKEFGEEESTIQQTSRSLMYNLRGVIGYQKNFGKLIKDDTRLMHSYAKMMNVDVGEAINAFRDKMYVQGKTHEQAVKDLDTTTAAYDLMAKSVTGAARPLKEDYDATLKEIEKELGPTRVSTLGLSSAMGMLAISASKAGLSGLAVKNSMSSITKLMTNLPKHFQVKIGRDITKKFYNNFDDLTKGMDDKAKTALRKTMKSIEDLGLPDFVRDQMVYEEMAGSTTGLTQIMQNVGSLSKLSRYGMLKQMGLSNQDIRATSGLFKKGQATEKDIKAFQAQVQAGQKKATDVRQNLVVSMNKNMGFVDRQTKTLEEHKAKLEGLIKSSDALLGGMSTLGIIISAAGLFGGGAGGIGGSAAKWIWGKTLGRGAAAASKVLPEAGKVVTKTGLLSKTGSVIGNVASKIPGVSKLGPLLTKVGPTVLNAVKFLPVAGTIISAGIETISVRRKLKDKWKTLHTSMDKTSAVAEEVGKGMVTIGTFGLASLIPNFGKWIEKAQDKLANQLMKDFGPAGKSPFKVMSLKPESVQTGNVKPPSTKQSQALSKGQSSRTTTSFDETAGNVSINLSLNDPNIQNFFASLLGQATAANFKSRG